MKRRDFLTLIGAVAAWPLAAGAQQQAGKVPRIAFLGTPRPADLMAAFYQALAELGYIDGKTIIVDLFTPPNVADVPDAAARAVASKPDVIVTVSSPAPVAAKALTTTIPIVFTALQDPVGLGLIDNFAHPGGNLTGNYGNANEITGKRLAILKELVPALDTMVVFAQLSDPQAGAAMPYLESAAKQLGVSFTVTDVEEGMAFEPLFAKAVAKGAQAVFVIGSNFMNLNAAQLSGLALRYRLPLSANGRIWPNNGALVSYGADAFANIRRAASFVDEILRGARPGDLPVEGPREFDFVVNLKTATALGITVPMTVLVSATDLIQ